MIVFRKPEINKDNVLKTLGTISGKRIKNIVYNGTTYPVAKKMSLSGANSYTVSNCVNAKLSKLKICGNGIQHSYLGYNLLNYNALSEYLGTWYEGSGYPFGVNSDGKITSLLSSDGRGGYYSNSSIYITLPAGTYTLSGFNINSKNSFNIVRFLDSNNTEIVTLFQGVNSNPVSVRSRQFTLTESKTLGLFIKLLKNTSNEESSLYLQLVSGSTELEFEPYVGGVPSPSSTSPQLLNGCNSDIISIVGEGTQSITIPSSVSINSQTIDINLLKVESIYDELNVNFANNTVIYKKRIGKKTYDGETPTNYVSSTGALESGATIFYPLSSEENIDISSSTFGQALLNFSTYLGSNTISITGNVLPTSFEVDYFEAE